MVTLTPERCFVALVLLFTSADGRAVNISNTWVLPEEGFSVFYRYFKDRVSWYEADAVCQFHHANLVTVDTASQYDSVRAYIKELDVSSAVWVGLIRATPEADFTWTNYRGISGDGYWLARPNDSAETGSTGPLCATADPAADFRWEPRACGGPTVASFICELPVPQWATGANGCMVPALPALTVLYLPEIAAVELSADCGYAEVKRVQCTGNMKRDEILGNLTCDEDASFSASTLVYNDTVYNNSVSEEALRPKSTSLSLISEFTSNAPVNDHTLDESFNQASTTEKTNHKKLLLKNLKINTVLSNNLQNNDLPKINGKLFSNDELEKIEDARHIHYKQLHDEVARSGNFDTILHQPMDHLIPPLVMAKAFVSDDMLIISPEEKNSQHVHESSTKNSKGLFQKTNANVSDDKKDVSKNTLPKKYTDKELEVKTKLLVKNTKPLKINNKSLDLQTIINKSSVNVSETSTSNAIKNDYTTTSKAYENYINVTDVPKILQTNTYRNSNNSSNIDDEVELSSSFNQSLITISPSISSEDKFLNNVNATLLSTQKELVQIKILNNSSIPATTITQYVNEQFSSINATVPNAVLNENITTYQSSTSFSMTEMYSVSNRTLSGSTEIPVLENVTLNTHLLNTTNDKNTTSATVTSAVPKDSYFTEEKATEKNVVEDSLLTIENTEQEMTDSNIGDDIFIDNFTEEYPSPLLSAVNEPLRRPTRTRRLQVNANRVRKFNPFRILG